MNIELPEDVTFEEVADLIISMKKQDSTREMIESCLIEAFALTPYDAALAWDSVSGGMVRASTRRLDNCPDRANDTLAWIAFQRASQDWKTNTSSKTQGVGPESTKPDFSQYSEQQLRQVLTRLDRERFPERLTEIEARIASLAAKDRKTDAQFEFPAGELELISSRAAGITHAIFPYFWFGIWLVFVIIFLASKDKDISTGLLLFACFCFGLLGQFAINRLTEEVYLASDVLIIVRRGEREVIRLASIDEVEVMGGETITVVLHLASSIKFSQRIEFVPATKIFANPFKEIAVVNELKTRIAAAKGMNVVV